jgi:2-polyprenyl-3-methyl-5-hydroxy-6-metoxy-1,4-benzoquinol methylase
VTTVADTLAQEARAFDDQIRRRLAGGHRPDLRRCGRCDYFYNNVWRDQEFARLYFGEVVERTAAAARRYLPGLSRPARLLEVGCGPGHLSLELARLGFDVTGLDLSPACLEAARKTAEEDPWRSQRGRLEYEAGDFMDHGGRYDLVLFCASLHHFPDSRAAVAHARSLLPAGGLVVVDEPTRDRVSRRNAAVILLVRGLLALAGAFHRPFEGPAGAGEVEPLLARVLEEERYLPPEGGQVQSVHDNRAGFGEMVGALRSCFEELEFLDHSAFFHQLVGGVRLGEVDRERLFANFLKVMDQALVEAGATDPVNFFFVGRGRG